MIHQGDCLAVMRSFPEKSINCCVTSPPYYGLRDYGVDGQMGLEATPQEYVSKMVEVFREVRRVLRDDGTLWLNLGDSYASSGGEREYGSSDSGVGRGPGTRRHNVLVSHQKQKDLIGIPWRVAFALQEDGWYLRSDIIWHKPNPMPESVTDRPTKGHEYVFLLAKSKKYYYDNEAIKEPFSDKRMGNPGRYRWKQGAGGVAGCGEHSFNRGDGIVEGWNVNGDITGRNRRTVWTIPTKPFTGAFIGCDYVGSDGKPYKVSPDCPIHSHLLGSQKICNALYGGSLASSQNRTLGTDSDPSQGSSCEVSPTTALENPSSLQSTKDCLQESNCDGQTPRNSGDCKKSNAHSEPISGVQTPAHTKHIIGRRVDQVENLDFENLGCALIANEHNIGTHRKGLDPETNPSYNSCEGIPGRTERIEVLLSCSGPDPYNGESKTSEDCASSEMGFDPSSYNLCHNADIQRSSSHHICTCKVYKVDHFAVMPEALVEPCILAGCPEGGTVLDPFFGAGTVGAVARKLGRHYVGIELNPEYIEIAQARIAAIPKPLSNYK